VDVLKEARIVGDTACVDLWYPRNDASQVKYVQIGLIDVRAADDIRVSYDFDRDGWKIEQASVFQWEVDDELRDPCWKEVAFIQAWSQEK